MMRYLLLAVVFWVCDTRAQSDLAFNKRFVQSEDKWVAYKADKDGSHGYGFIYIDPVAGLTLQLEGNFKVDGAGTFIAKKMEHNTKYRLQPNNVLVAWIPENRFGELKIDAVPDWLRFYKTDTTSVKHFYDWGFRYNAWEECAKGLTYLEKAAAIDPNFKGLAVELAFSYNCLGQYTKAVPVLRSALVATPLDAYVHKELVYAYVKSGQLDSAAISCKNAIAVCTDKSYHGEMCYNLMHEWYQHKDKKNFQLWLPEIKKWITDQANLQASIKIMEDELEKM